MDAGAPFRRRRRSRTPQPVLWRAWQLAGVAAVALLPGLAGHAQTAPNGGRIITPPSGIEIPGDVGKRAHTNVEIFAPNGKAGLRLPARPAGREPGAGAPPASPTPGGPQGASPAQR
jgi:hypothetical protein